MPNIPDTLVRRFWSHVFQTPGKPGVLVKNQAKSTMAIVGSPMGMMPAVVEVKPDPYRGVSWLDCGFIVAEFMLYLKEQGFKRGDRVAILSWNRPEWVWCDLAIQSMGGVTVPIYPNNGTDQVSYILKDSGATILFADEQSQLDKCNPALVGSPVTKALFSYAMKFVPDYTGIGEGGDTIITGVGSTKPAREKPTYRKLAYEQVTAMRLKFELQYPKLGLRGVAPEPFAGISRDDVATIIYTSGSTGQPKGVVLTHGNIASACQSLLRHGFDFSPADTYLSYLPLAHVYERVNGTFFCIWNGVPEGFCKVEDVGTAVKELKPTIMVGVPAVWRKMNDKIQAELSHATGIKKALINWALKQKTPGLMRDIADMLVFRKVRAGLGGRLRLMMSGGAPISPDILAFFNLVGLNLRQGYGLTETTGGIAVCTVNDNREGSVGRVIDVVQVKIVPLEAEDGQPPAKGGVIWLRGASIFSGYYHLDDENKKSFDADGWFNTGDIGYVDEDGYLFITGRKKRLLKTDGGKYVAPEKVEKAFDGNSLVQCIVPVGDAKPFISALIFINQLTARDMLTKKGVTVPADNAAAFFATNAEIIKAVEAGVAEANTKLEHWETVKKFTIIPVEATVAGGLLTPTLKIRTEECLKRYAAEIEALYVKKQGK